MDKLVKRVTVVERSAQGSGQAREAKVVYKLDEEDEEEEGMPGLRNLERTMRHLLKADLIAAQEAYQRHLVSLEKGGTAWLNDVPRNIMKAQRKAMKEASKASPFGALKVRVEEEDEED
jgi:hypothetical protein